MNPHAGRGIPAFRSMPAGCGTAFEFAIRFHLWWQGHHQAPTWQEIASEYGVDRSTAYRWRGSYMAAIGVCDVRAVA